MHTISLTSPDDVSAFVNSLAVDGVYCEHVSDNQWTINVPEANAAQADALAANLAVARRTRLTDYAAAVRFNKEVAGTLVNGVAYPSDRETQGKLTSAVVMSQVVPTFTFQWKIADGSFVPLDAAGILAVAQAVGAYVAGAFATEATVVADINAGTITTRAQVDAAFA